MSRWIAQWQRKKPLRAIEETVFCGINSRVQLCIYLTKVQQLVVGKISTCAGKPEWIFVHCLNHSTTTTCSECFVYIYHEHDNHGWKRAGSQLNTGPMYSVVYPVSNFSWTPSECRFCNFSQKVVNGLIRNLVDILGVWQQRND